ncbi:MAG: response regulator [Lachnospiraceae bacterium]|nr:response regulator [Lachnospiraceae bacterium]
MKILVVDDEFIALEGIVTKIKKLYPGAVVAGFRQVDEALLFASSMKPEIAFLDIEMRRVNGVELARKLIKMDPGINIVFATGYEEYMKDAFELHASGYILKPITDEKIKNEIDNLRNKVNTKSLRVRAQTFGNFELFIDGVPVKFQYNRTKEVFAYFIDRKGALCSSNELGAILWPDDPASHTSYISNIRQDLFNTFTQKDCQDVLVRQKGVMGINPDLIECDYYEWLKGRTDEYVYSGEYMSQYAWAEETNAFLQMKGLYHDNG